MTAKSKSMLRRLFSSKRAYAAVFVDGLFSVSSLVLSVAIARSSSVSDFGSFALAMTVYLFSIGILRASVTETVLSTTIAPARIRDGFRRILSISAAGAACIVVISWIFTQPYLLILGLCLPGILALDYIRVTNALLSNVRVAISLGLLWSICVLAIGVTVLIFPLPALVVFSMWGFTGAVIGIVAAFRLRLPLVPRWRRDVKVTRSALWFGADYIAGSGGSLLTTTLLGGIFGPPILAALRGAGTILGPANLLSTTTRSFALPYLSRAREVGAGHEFKQAAVVAVVSMFSMSPLLLVVIFLPPQIGVALLGETWAVAGSVVLPLAVESLAALGGAVAAAGHRSRLAGSRSFYLRLSTAIIRPIVVIYCAVQGGAEGAAWSMAGLAILNFAVWWGSYFLLCRRRTVV